MTKSHQSGTNQLTLTGFFLFSLLLSWSISIPLALIQAGLIPPLLPGWTHYLSYLGPLIAALILTGVELGRSGMKDLGKRMLIRRICPRWWVTALLPLFSSYLIIKILYRMSGAELSLQQIFRAPYLPEIGFWTLLVWILSAGMGGETGWRGYALPRLQKRFSAFSSALILAGAWAVWHIPQFFYFLDPASLPVWMVGLTAGSVVLTWLYNSAVDSIPTTAIWVGSWQFLTASAGSDFNLTGVLTAFIAAWAVLVVILHKPKNLMSI